MTLSWLTSSRGDVVTSDADSDISLETIVNGSLDAIQYAITRPDEEFLTNDGALPSPISAAVSAHEDWFLTQSSFDSSRPSNDNFTMSGALGTV